MRHPYQPARFFFLYFKILFLIGGHKDFFERFCRLVWHHPWRSIPEPELFVVSVGTKASLNHLHHCWNFQMCFQYLMSVSVFPIDGFEMKVIAFQELFLLLGPLKRTTPLQPLTKYKPGVKSEMVKNQKLKPRFQAWFSSLFCRLCMLENCISGFRN